MYEAFKAGAGRPGFDGREPLVECLRRSDPPSIRVEVTVADRAQETFEKGFYGVLGPECQP